MANPDELVDLDGLSTFLDGCDTRFASAGHTHTADDVGAVAVDTSGNAEGADVGNNQYGSYLSVDVGSDNRSVINWDDNGPFGSKYDGSNWTTTWDYRRPLLKVAGKTISIGKAQGSSSSTQTAPTVSGYTFVSWVASTTSGWVGYVYPEHPDNATTKFWTGYGSGSGSGNVWVQALYYRS